MKKVFLIVNVLVLAFLLVGCLGSVKKNITYKVTWTDVTSIPNGEHLWYVTAAMDPEILYTKDKLPTNFIYNTSVTPDNTLYASDSIEVAMTEKDSVVIYVYKDLNDDKKLDSGDLIGGTAHFYGNDEEDYTVKIFVNF